MVVKVLLFLSAHSVRRSSSFGVAFDNFDGISLIVLMRENRIFRLLDYASTGSPGHGPIHLLTQSAEEIGFFWDSEQAGWIRPGLPPLRMMTGPIQHFRSAIWQAWQGKVAADLSRRKGFRGGFCVDIYGSHQLLVSSHLGERDKMLLRAILSGGFGMAFCSAKSRGGHQL